MQRDPRLRRLSVDHHHALVLARHATEAANGDPDAWPAAWAEVLRCFEQELAPHFAIEEQCLLPALTQQGRADLTEKTLTDHGELRRLLTAEDLALPTRLRAFGELLTAHVRFEERELFAVAQDLLDDATLAAVAAASELP